MYISKVKQVAKIYGLENLNSWQRLNSAFKRILIRKVNFVTRRNWEK